MPSEARSLYFHSAGYRIGNFFLSSVRHLKDHFLPHQRNHYTPHLLHHRTLSLLGLFTLTVKIAVISISALNAPSAVFSSEITVQSVISLTNQARIEAGVPEVKHNTMLERAAMNKAQDMALGSYFSHVSPDGRQPWDFIKEAGYKYAAAGENLAVHFFDVEPLQDAWMNSPGHKANVLNKNYEEMGVGIAKGRYENFDTIFVVEMFGKPLIADDKLDENVDQVAKTEEVLKTTTNVQESSANRIDTVSTSVLQPSVQPNLALSQNPVASESSSPEIYNIQTVIQGENLEVTAVTSPEVSEMILNYGDKGVRFKPVGENRWVALVKRLSLGAGPVLAEAKDMQGNSAEKTVASFSEEKSSLPGEEKKEFKLFGYEVEAGKLLRQIGFALLAIFLTVLVVSMARHWKIHHLKTVASTSLTAIFITLLLVL